MRFFLFLGSLICLNTRFLFSNISLCFVFMQLSNKHLLVLVVFGCFCLFLCCSILCQNATFDYIPFIFKQNFVYTNFLICVSAFYCPIYLCSFGIWFSMYFCAKQQFYEIDIFFSGLFLSCPIAYILIFSLRSFFK